MTSRRQRRDEARCRPLWPSEEQRLLLGACVFADADRAARAFSAWCARVEGREIDPASRALMPLLYSRLGALGAGGRWAARLRPRYLYTRARNNALLQRLAAVLELLEAHGIPTLVLKGAALLGRYYPDPGQRPMSDVDFLVPTALAHRAFDLLQDRGWTPYRPDVRPFPGCLLASMGLQDRRGTPVDLHWHVLKECLGEDADDAFWRACRPTTIGGTDTISGTETRRLDPADQLLHVIMHGMVREPVASVRWIADACRIVQRTPTLCWDRLLERTRSRQLGLIVRCAVGFLRDNLGLELPEAPWRALRALPASRMQRQELWLKTLDRPGWGLGILPLAWSRYRRQCRDERRWPDPMEFARRFGGEYQAHRRRELVRLAARLSLERLGIMASAGRARLHGPRAISNPDCALSIPG